MKHIAVLIVVLSILSWPSLAVGQYSVIAETHREVMDWINTSLVAEPTVYLSDDGSESGTYRAWAHPAHPELVIWAPSTQASRDFRLRLENAYAHGAFLIREMFEIENTPFELQVYVVEDLPGTIGGRAFQREGVNLIQIKLSNSYPEDVLLSFLVSFTL